MTLTLSTELAVSAEVAYEQAKRPVLLRFVAHPLIDFVPQTPFPAVWQAGRYQTRMRLLSLIPLGRQTIGIEFPPTRPDEPFILRDNGSGQVASVWDHRIVLVPLSPTHCCYTDTVTIRAGWRTPFVWLFAYGFYWWRQRRWQQLVL